jgi:hypothetical protein
MSMLFISLQWLFQGLRLDIHVRIMRVGPLGLIKRTGTPKLHSLSHEYTELVAQLWLHSVIARRKLCTFHRDGSAYYGLLARERVWMNSSGQIIYKSSALVRKHLHQLPSPCCLD